MFQVIPIIDVKVDWNTYLSSLKTILNRSVTHHIDSEKRKLDQAGLIITLGNILDSQLKPNEILSEPGSLLKHGMFGFLIILDSETLIELLEQNQLSITSINLNNQLRLAVVTANLEQWHISIINNNSIITTTELRLLFNAILLHFEKAGLGMLWNRYQKSTYQNGYILEEK